MLTALQSVHAIHVRLWPYKIGPVQSDLEGEPQRFALFPDSIGTNHLPQALNYLYMKVIMRSIPSAIYTSPSWCYWFGVLLVWAQSRQDNPPPPPPPPHDIVLWLHYIASHTLKKGALYLSVQQ